MGAKENWDKVVEIKEDIVVKNLKRISEKNIGDEVLETLKVSLEKKNRSKEREQPRQ